MRQLYLEHAGVDAAGIRKKKLSALRLRWHPDKNSILSNLVTEITKVINAEVERCEAEIRTAQGRSAQREGVKQERRDERPAEKVVGAKMSGKFTPWMGRCGVVPPDAKLEEYASLDPRISGGWTPA